MDFASCVPIEKGWSGDRKYCVTDRSGARYLLRVMPGKDPGRCETTFRMMQQVAALGVPMCCPVEIGRCGEGVYTLQTWVDGQDAEAVIPGLAAAEQYAYGCRAGEILRQIHRIPAPAGLPDWQTRFGAKIERKIQLYRACPIRFDGAEAILAYLAANRGLLAGRPQTYQHGDYHIGNMMLEQGRLVIIDFDRDDFGDPWEEFNRIVWCAQASPRFAAGMVDGYFPGGVPARFWQLLALYIGSNTLSSVPWAIPFGAQEVQTMLNQAADVLRWYDNMNRLVPGWYTGE